MAVGLDGHLVRATSATPKPAVVRAGAPVARTGPLSAASWIHQVERWFAGLTRKPLPRGTHPSPHPFAAGSRAFSAKHHPAQKPFTGTKAADDIRAAVQHFYLRAEHNLGHEL